MGLNATSAPHHETLPAATIAAAFLRALDCALAFEGATAPNPPVGCVLLDHEGNVLAAAAHRKAGELHAEALAIEQCRRDGTMERIHTAVVTLEPCNHTGRTPPCSDAIAKTPARELWIGAADPNPHVEGGGAQRLAAAGLAVHFIESLDHPEASGLASAAQRLIAPFAKHARTGLPWVTIKQAMSSTASMIPPAGSKTFTSPSSLMFAHRLRKRADAILTGSGTILADQPEFTVRHVPDFSGKHRILAILDRRGRVPSAYLEAARRRGFEVMMDTSLEGALMRLGQRGVLEVLVEAGPTLLDALLATGLWDEQIIIEQQAGSGGEDRILVRCRADLGPPIAEEEAHVLRHH